MLISGERAVTSQTLDELLNAWKIDCSKLIAEAPADPTTTPPTGGIPPTPVPPVPVPTPKPPAPSTTGATPGDDIGDTDGSGDIGDSGDTDGWWTDPNADVGDAVPPPLPPPDNNNNNDNNDGDNWWNGSDDGGDTDPLGYDPTSGLDPGAVPSGNTKQAGCNMGTHGSAGATWGLCWLLALGLKRRRSSAKVSS